MSVEGDHPPPPVAKSKRRRIASLSALMLAIAALGLAFGWIALLARRAEAQRRAIALILGNGGAVTFTYEYSGGDALADGAVKLAKASPPGPARLREWLGDDYFRKVARISLRAPSGHDLGPTLDAIRQISGVQVLEISAPVGDGTMLGLVGMTHVEGLDLTAFNLTNAGMGCLGELAQLRNLKIGSGLFPDALRFDDAGWEKLARLTQLESFHLHGGRIGDAGLATIAKFTRLRNLSLELAPPIDDPSSRVAPPTTTDAGLAHLEKLRELRTLNLAGLDFGDDGLIPLGHLPGLRTLSLFGANVGDAGLIHLEGLDRLESLDLGQTRVSDAAARGFAGRKSLKVMERPSSFHSPPRGRRDALLMRRM